MSSTRPSPTPGGGGGGAPAARAAAAQYEWDFATAADMVERRDMGKYHEIIGGLDGLCARLKTDPRSGVAAASIPGRVAQFGSNELTMKDPVTFWEMLVDALGDRIIQILTVAAIIAIIFGVTLPNPHTGVVEYSHGWIKGTALLISVTIVVMMGAVSNYQKAKKFEEMEREQSVRKVSVTRDGVQTTVLSNEIVMGDLLHLEPGMEIPADGMLAQGFNLKTNESPITGEPDLIEKDDEHAFIVSGTAVEEGSGTMIVLAVGMQSFQGRLKDMTSDPKKKFKEEQKNRGGKDGDVPSPKAAPDDGVEMDAKNKNTEGGDDGKGDGSGSDSDSDDDAAETPLQKHLAALAEKIGKIGLLLAVGMVTALCIKEGILIAEFGKAANAANFLAFVIVGVTLIAVAIPEGLPLAVTISLAYSMKAMMEDHCMVRVLQACETMGAATAICSDKTGTLTTNQMTVVQGLICETEFLITGYKLEPRRGANVTQCDRTNFKIENNKEANLELFARALSLNSTAREQPNKETGKMEWAGNKTEVGLLGVCALLGYKYKDFRTALPEGAMHQYQFNSVKKKMTTLVKQPDGMVAYVKGASEIVTSYCNRYVTRDGTTAALDAAKMQEINAVIEDMASQGNRTIALAYTVSDFTEFPKEEPDLVSGLIFMGVLGVQDPVREEVPEAVRRCGTAGLVVRMVTGDNINTAKAIGRKCGIFNDATDLAMEGPEFARMAEQEPARLMAMLPKVRILARSSPKDKYVLVGMLQDEKGGAEVVGVTGDGTNDAPALRLADVGFAMATGTDIAKGAADMVLLDDNFATVVTAIKWGRAVNDNIKKFLQYQLAINFAGVLLTVIGSLASSSSKEPIAPVQLLWLNLIMDSLAALALATEKPEDASLDRHPVYQAAPLMTNRMWSFILIHGSYQCLIVLLMFFLAHDWFQIVEDEQVCEPAIVGALNVTKNADGSYAHPVTRWCVDRCKSVGGIIASTDTMYCQQGLTHGTVMFNTFIWFQIFNVFNARKIYGEMNPFEGLFDRSRTMVFVFGVVLLFQTIAVEFFHEFMSVKPLRWQYWLICIAFGAFELVLGVFVRALPIQDYVPDVAAEKTARERERTKSAQAGDRQLLDTHGDPALKRSNSIHKPRRASVHSNGAGDAPSSVPAS
jgi:magnesium-transporting ATPase (P-type)